MPTWVVMAWLEQQDRDDVPGTFWCNRRLTVKAHEEGKLLIYVDTQSQQPVAYQWGGLVTPGILASAPRSATTSILVFKSITSIHLRTLSSIADPSPASHR